MSQVANICQVADIGEWRLTRKSELVLVGKKLSEIPEDIGNLSNLQVLKLSDNELSTLPETIGKLLGLSVLMINGNKLSNVPASFSLLSSIRVFDGSNNELDTFPEAIARLVSSSRLSLSNNRINEIPVSVGRLTSLISLSLSHNSLRLLPHTFSRLIAMQELYLNDNKLAHISEGIGQLISLEKLHLQNNELAILPNYISKLTKITELNVSGNMLSEIPIFLLPLGKLNQLHMSQNKVTFLPEFLSKFTALEILDLTGNKIESVPDVLKKTTFIKKSRELSRLPVHTASVIDIAIYTDNGMPEDSQRVALSLGTIPSDKDIESIHIDQQVRVSTAISQAHTQTEQQLGVKLDGLNKEVEDIDAQLAILWPKAKSIISDIEEHEQNVKTCHEVIRKQNNEIKSLQAVLGKFSGKPESSRALADEYITSWRNLDMKIYNNEVENLSDLDIFEIYHWQGVRLSRDLLLEMNVSGKNLEPLLNPGNWKEFGVDTFGDQLRLIRINRAMVEKNINGLRASRKKSLSLVSPRKSQGQAQTQTAGAQVSTVPRSQSAKEWGTEEVYTWLRGNGLFGVAPLFIKQKIEGFLFPALREMATFDGDFFYQQHVVASQLISEENWNLLKTKLEELLNEPPRS